WLWTDYLVDPNSRATTSDIYFSSKGHDAPALYALLIALEKLDFDLIHKLRRFGGLPGHPDVETPFIAANTGSLGMGISKAYGIDLPKVKDVFARFDRISDRPKVLIADTIKGKGVSFMEGLACGDATYHFHAGAPSLKDYLAAVGEITARVDEALTAVQQPA